MVRCRARRGCGGGIFWGNSGGVIQETKVVLYHIVFIECLFSLGSPHAAEITDATDRSVTVPDRVERVMVAGPTAAVVLYVLAPGKMIAWPSAPRPNEREFIRDLREMGRQTGRATTMGARLPSRRNAKAGI